MKEKPSLMTRLHWILETRGSVKRREEDWKGLTMATLAAEANLDEKVVII